MITYNYNFETKTNTFKSFKHIMTNAECALQYAVEEANRKFGITAQDLYYKRLEC